MCLAYPEVRRHFIRRYQRLLAAGDFDGLFVCLRSQSRPADFADQFGFNRPVRDEFLKRCGQDIWIEDFDLRQWRDLQGEYLTVFLKELKENLKYSHYLLAVGAPRGNILGPPFGNASLQWPTWVKMGLVDHLIIDQNSSSCPSMWHDLWPMHRGCGYVQNYLDGGNMNSLETDLTSVYHPAFGGRRTKLYLARQWKMRSSSEEQRLLDHPAVDGLVFSSFRHDNPGPIRRNNWKAWSQLMKINWELFRRIIDKWFKKNEIYIYMQWPWFNPSIYQIEAKHDLITGLTVICLRYQYF